MTTENMTRTTTATLYKSTRMLGRASARPSHAYSSNDLLERMEARSASRQRKTSLVVDSPVLNTAAELLAVNLDRDDECCAFTDLSTAEQRRFLKVRLDDRAALDSPADDWK